MAAVEPATEIRPFQVDIPEEALEDLRRRVRRRACLQGARRRSIAGRSVGDDSRLAAYWATDYDFGRVAARLNAFPQFITEIDGVDIHFITCARARGRVAADHDPRLAWLGHRAARDRRPADRSDRAAAPPRTFHLVLPSLPGYGFSSEPRARLGSPAAQHARGRS